MTQRGCSAKEDQGLQLVGHLCLPGSSQTAPRRNRTDARSHFGRQGRGEEGGVVQSSVLRRIISVNEFLFSCKSCD